MKQWKRYRFTTTADDNRPLVFNPEYPWWESGFNDESSILIAYLPANADLKTYWPEAENIEFTEHDEIEFTSRFPKPKYYPH